jgi:Tol biopolymer transport system component
VTTTTDPALGETRAGYVRGALGDVQTIAPGGQVMVVADGEQICVQELDDQDTECLAAPAEFRSPRLTGGWAPDGTTFVFHDRSATAASFRSTLWMLDTAEPGLELLLDNPDIIVWDAAVGPQGDVIAFRGNAARFTGVFTISGGGAPELVAEIVSGENLAWLPDGTGLLFDALGDASGIWRMDLDGATPEMLVPFDGRPSLVSVSPDGSWALIYDRELAAGSVVNQPHYKIAHLDTGEVSALEVGNGGDFLGPVFAVFSPDGSRVAYLYHDGASSDAPLVLAVRPTGGGEEQIISHDVFDEAGSPPTPHRPMQIEVDLRAVWTDADRLLFPTAGWVLFVDLDEATL